MPSKIIYDTCLSKAGLPIFLTLHKKKFNMSNPLWFISGVSGKHEICLDISPSINNIFKKAINFRCIIKGDISGSEI